MNEREKKIVVTQEQLEKQINNIINSGIVKDYKKKAIDELSMFSLDTLPNTREIVSIHPDFNSVLIKLKFGKSMEIQLYLNVDFLKEEPESIPMIATQVADMLNQ